MAYQTLRERVLNGTLRPGAEVEQEALARALGLSSTPVREALRRLEAEGLLKHVAHRKMRVAGIARRELEELYETRLVLDPYAAELGAAHATEQQRRRIRELLAADVSRRDVTEDLTRNHDLHRAMYAACGNLVLIDVLDGLWDRSDRYRAVLLREHMSAENVEREHAAIADAFCAADGRLVARLVRAHLAAGRDALLDSLGEEDFAGDGFLNGDRPPN